MKMSAFLISVIFGSLSILFVPGKLHAGVSAGDNWSVEINEIEFDTTIPTPIRPTQGPATATNYAPADDDERPPFEIHISNSFIDYGIISATIPLYRSFNVEIKGGEKGFIVYGYQNNPLWFAGSKTYLPDTTCDNGYCTEVSSSLWENTLTYGYGYRCNGIKGNICPIDFISSSYYKQFADMSKREFMQTVVSQKAGPGSTSAEVMLKINTSKQQAAGYYINRVTLLAIPAY